MNGMKASARGSWRAAVLVGVLVAGVAFGSGYALAPEPTPEWAEVVSLVGAAIEVTEREHAGERRAVSVIELGPEQTLTSPTTGVVRMSSCEPGAPLISGQGVFTVDDRLVLALHTSSPLWRDLAEGMRGDDVTALQEELNRLGHQVRVDGVFRASTGVAVRNLWRAAGGPRSQRTLPVTQVMWLAGPQVTLTECNLAMGERVEAGQDAVVAGGALESLTVQTVGLPADELLVTMVGLEQVTLLPEDGRITDREFLDAVTGSHAFEQARRDGLTEMAVTLRLATPMRVMAVPPSALFDLSGSLGCIVADGEPTPIEVVASELGQSLVVTSAPVRTVVVQPEDPAPCR